MSVSKRDILYLSVIFILIAAVFGNALDNYFLRDETAMLRNIHDFRAVLELFIGFRLIPALLFKGVYAVWGTDPRGYYVLNFGLHGVNAWLVYFCAALLFSKDKKSLNSAAGFLSALYFSVTFSHHETVYYIPGISDLVAALFCLLCLFYFIVYSASARLLPMALSVFFFVLFLLSKPTAVLFPFCLIALAAARNVPVKRLAPFFVCLAAYLLLPWVRAENKGLFPAYLQSGSLFSFFPVLLFYMGDFLFSLFGFTSSALRFPLPYGYLEQFTNTMVLAAFQCAILAMLVSIFILLFLKRNVNAPHRGTSAGSEPLLSFMPLFFSLLLCAVMVFLPHSFLPELNVKSGLRLIQHRYLYLPACFFSMMVSLCALLFYERLKTIHPLRSCLVPGVMALVVAVNAYETFLFGVSLDEFSAIARQSVLQITSHLGTEGRAKTAVVLQPPPYLDAYYKTCISDMVAVMSQEKIQMAWIREKEALEKVLAENAKRGRVTRYFAVDDAGFREVRLQTAPNERGP